jgi:thiosulfate/3-mercaptopyruvate sulfurtransferase
MSKVSRVCRSGWAGALLLLTLTGARAAAQERAPSLIGTAELAAWVTPDTELVATLAERIPLRVIDVRQSWTSYLQNHLPDAIWLNIETLRAQQGELPFQLLTGRQYAELFTRLGIVREGRVVIYSAGDQSDIDATFAAFLLASAGAREVRVLDGGYARWDLEGRPLTQRYPRGQPVGNGFSGKRFRPAIASLADVVAATKGSGALLVDARPPEQFAGTAGAQLRRGHIPGAINHPWKDDLEKPDLALVWKPVESLRASYAAQGITPDRDIILYCNSGTEASHLFFALRYLLGYPRVRIYAGSWTQWSEREELPVER